MCNKKSKEKKKLKPNKHKKIASSWCTILNNIM